MNYSLYIVPILVTFNFWSLSSLTPRPVAVNTFWKNFNNSWKIAQKYVPPDRGAPKVTQGSATRGGQCLLLNKKLTLLLPETGRGLTISEYPVFFVYIPLYQKAQKAEFFITDTDHKDVYNHLFQLPQQTGIIRLKIPENKLAPLEVGKNYIWGVQIFCNPENGDQSGDPIVRGIIERIKPEKSLSNQLEGVTPLILPTVYASQGIWYDALESIAQLRSLNPENTKLIDDWQELFNSANSQGKEDLIKAPLLNCCEIED